MDRASTASPIELVVIDAHGIAAGGSGSAAGLLHPYSPRGKMLWKGEEAMAVALQLVEVAAAHERRERSSGSGVGSSSSGGSSSSSSGFSQDSSSSSSGSGDCSFVWRHGVVRRTTHAQQAREFSKAYAAGSGGSRSSRGSRGSDSGGTVAGPGPAQQAREFSKVYAAGSGSSHSSSSISSSGSSGSDSSGTVAGPGSTTATLAPSSPASGQCCVSPAELQRLVPGIAMPGWVAQQTQTQQQQAQHGEPASAHDGDGASGGAGAGAGLAVGKSASPSDAELAGSCAGLHAPGGVVLDVHRYLECLWRATQAAAGARGDGSAARMVTGGEAVRSLNELEATLGPWAGVVVAAGAAAGCINEVVAARVPLKVSQGYSLVMEPDVTAAAQGSSDVGGDGSDGRCGGSSGSGGSDSGACVPYPAGAPSILGSTYLSAQGSTRIVLGASREFGWSADDALAMCAPQTAVLPPPPLPPPPPPPSRQSPSAPLLPAPASKPTAGRSDEEGRASSSSNSGSSSSSSFQASTLSPGAHQEVSGSSSSSGSGSSTSGPDAVSSAASSLLAAGAAAWPPLTRWRIASVRSGMRAVPPRTHAGALPLVGRLAAGRRWWLVGGLGARGLVYHAWLGAITAAAVLDDDEGRVAAEGLDAWRAAADAGEPLQFDSTATVDRARQPHQACVPQPPSAALAPTLFAAALMLSACGAPPPARALDYGDVDPSTGSGVSWDLVAQAQGQVGAVQAKQAAQAAKFGPTSEAPDPVAIAAADAESRFPNGGTWRYSDFLEAVETGKVERVRFSPKGGSLTLISVDSRQATVTLPGDGQLVDILAANGVDISVGDAGEDGGGIFSKLGGLILPLAVLAGLFFILRGGGADGGAGSPMAFGKSQSKFQEVPATGVTFDDVAGCDNAKLELQEVVDFLKNPDKYTALGAKIPKGCLLVGPPGTGKTLLAKAVAGEAGTPFFSCAASEFVEMFVGVGASRVRDLFEKAKAKAPCIIFIDEIDAVGRQRGGSGGGGNDEREQTINQLLTEMDGFDGNTGVIVLAATNRADVLDSALLRPGRFDRQVTVDRPDVQGRVEILKVHSKGKVLAKDVDLQKIARRTPGFTGADLQNLMNEAAICAARKQRTDISQDEVSDALERIVAGVEKRGAVMSDKKRKLVAYHEAGHALVGALMPEYDPVTKISIVPRGNAGGLTFFAPSEERLESGLYSRQYLENQMCVALGGRIAEELIFGDDDITTGASGDFQQVSRTARLMVTQLGFVKDLGQIAWSGRSQDDFSADTADVIDREVKKLVERAYRRAKDCLQTNIEVLHQIADVLIDKENIDGEQFQQIILASQTTQYLKDDAPGVTIPYQERVSA
ncbi:hypothetical protein FOA52_016059 [Chlamydomonas sp. UWO 241]|nr:hypothetical protein FOA52_016059 [Chlamydomonas sp. UWO 241]